MKCLELSVIVSTGHIGLVLTLQRCWLVVIGLNGLEKFSFLITHSTSCQLQYYLECISVILG